MPLFPEVFEEARIESPLGMVWIIGDPDVPKYIGERVDMPSG